MASSDEIQLRELRLVRGLIVVVRAADSDAREARERRFVGRRGREGEEQGGRGSGEQLSCMTMSP